MFNFQVGTIIKDKDSGLGISLEGTVRVVCGKEVQARHYIRAIAPNGPVARLGVYKVGDELLEVRSALISVLVFARKVENIKDKRTEVV